MTVSPTAARSRTPAIPLGKYLRGGEGIRAIVLEESPYLLHGL